MEEPNEDEVRWRDYGKFCLQYTIIIMTDDVKCWGNLNVFSVIWKGVFNSEKCETLLLELKRKRKWRRTGLSPEPCYNLRRGLWTQWTFPIILHLKQQENLLFGPFLTSKNGKVHVCLHWTFATAVTRVKRGPIQGKQPRTGHFSSSPPPRQSSMVRLECSEKCLLLLDYFIIIWLYCFYLNTRLDH